MLDDIRNDLIEEYQPASNWELRLIDQAAMAYFRASVLAGSSAVTVRVRLETEQSGTEPDATPDPDEGIALALWSDNPSA